MKVLIVATLLINYDIVQPIFSFCLFIFFNVKECQGSSYCKFYFWNDVI